MDPRHLLSLAPFQLSVYGQSSEQLCPAHNVGLGEWVVGCREASGTQPGWERDREKQHAAGVGLAVLGAEMGGLCLRGGERLLALLLRA